MPFNATTGVGNALAGAAAGAKAGSFIPIIGTAAGAGAGALAGLFTGFSRDPEKKKAKALEKYKKKTEKQARKYLKKHGQLPPGYINPYNVPENSIAQQPIQGVNPTGSKEGGYQQSPNLYSPDQQQALNYLLNQGRSNLQSPYQGFEPIEAHARTKFQSQSIPSLAERFTALGGSDTRESSDFAGMLGGAQSEFDQGIAALRADYGNQSQDRALNLLRLGLTPQTELHYFNEQPDAPSAGSQIFESGAQALGNYLGAGGDFGIGNLKASRAKNQEQQSLTKKIFDRDRLSAIGRFGSGGIKPGSSSTSNFANLIALKRLQGGMK